MSWWQKLQSLVMGERPEAEEPKAGEGAYELFLPSAVQALASNDDSVFRVEIRGVGVSAIRVHSPRPMRDASYVVRVPVGLNFEKRETTEYVEFTGVPFHTQKTDHGHETFLRYAEASNSKRDRWIRLVLESYGFSINEAGQAEAQVRNLPCTITLPDGSTRAGQVASVSLKGVIVRASAADIAKGVVLGVQLGADPGPMLRGTVMSVTEEEGAASIGLWFDDLSNEQYQHLVAVVSSLASPRE